MSRKGSKLVSFSQWTDDVDENPTALLALTLDEGRRTSQQKHIERRVTFCRVLLRRAHSRVVKFFHRVGIDMSVALRCRPRRRRQPPPSPPPPPRRRISSSMTPQRFVPSRDSHQSEAVEDCIKFLNSSSRREVMLDSSRKLQSLLHDQQCCY